MIIIFKTSYAKKLRIMKYRYYLYSLIFIKGLYKTNIKLCHLKEKKYTSKI